VGRHDVGSLTWRLGVATLLALASATAHAQTATVAGGDEEPGIKYGRLRIRPSIGLQYAFDSNVFLKDSEDVPGPTSASRLHVLPALVLTTAPGAPVALSFGVGFDYNLYLSGDPELRALDAWAITSDLMATFFPDGPVSFSLLNNFRRTVNAPTVELPNPLNRDTNKAGIRIGIAPGGKALSFELYYYFTLDHFENYTFGNGLSLDSKAHELYFRWNWRFLPKTAFIGEIQTIFLRWDVASFNNANELRGYVGIIGNLTAKLTATARAGYGNSFHDNGPSFNSVVADLELAYLLREQTTLKFQYARDYFPAYWGNYFDNHRVTLSLDSLLFRRFAPGVTFTYYRLNFGANPDPALLSGANVQLLSPDNRADDQLSAQVRARVALKRWLALDFSYAIDWRHSNNGLRITSPTGVVSVDHFGFVRHLVNIGLSGAY
jgi:hypothetical protein